MKTLILFTFLYFFTVLAQGPGEPFNPMTANGARHIFFYNNQYLAHKLFWINPPDATYNEIYLSPDSNLVINLDPSAKVLSGFDSTIVYDSLSLELIGILNYNTKYYWRVVEHNSTGQTAGPVWYFISQSSFYNYWEDFFDNGLYNYTMIEPSGASWEISNTSNAGRQPPELRFLNSMVINDTSYLILNSFFDLSPTFNGVSFNISVDWQSGEFIIGVAYSLDEGVTWIPLWQQEITEDIPATLMQFPEIPNENYVKIALFCITTIPNSSGYWYIDDLFLVSALTVSLPPAQIRAVSDNDPQKVFLSWGPGYTINPSWGYVIQRKNGLPTSSSDYDQIAWVGPNILSFEDATVHLDSIYTYRIQSREGPEGGFRSTWSNEATAYVPDSITDVKTSDNPVTTFHVSQNFPNPFNPTTKIEFRIANFGFVSLRVFDILGREVATLVNEEKPAGNYEVTFDATEFVSGIYFYRLQAGGFVETKKMVLVK